MAMPKRYCSAKLTGDLKGLTCTRDAVAFVTYFQDGCGGKYACLHHLQRVIEDVASDPTVGSRAALKFKPLGALADKIEKRQHRRRNGGK